MPSHKLGRTTEDIRREISAILRELKDPRVSGVMLSVVRVEVTNDLSYCTVYVSAMEGMDAAENAVKGLKSAAGFVRRELGARLKLRHVPESSRRRIPSNTARTSRASCTTSRRNDGKGR